jgi:hypothetical protein
MTDTTDNTMDTGEVDRLRAKLRELLAENRQLKDRNRELTEATTAQQARLRVYEIDGPVEHIIAEVALTGAEEPFKAMLAQYVRFEAADGGQLLMRDTKGEPVILPKVPGKKGREMDREARATVDDLRAVVDLPDLRNKFAAITLASRASGGGAGGQAGGPGPVLREPRKPSGDQKPQPPLGLR